MDVLLVKQFWFVLCERLSFVNSFYLTLGLGNSSYCLDYVLDVWEGYVPSLIAVLSDLAHIPVLYYKAIYSLLYTQILLDNSTHMLCLIYGCVRSHWLATRVYLFIYSCLETTLQHDNIYLLSFVTQEGTSQMLLIILFI